MNEFANRFFTWYCGCGFKPKYFRNGVTSHGCLSAIFYCPKCKLLKTALFSLADVVKEIPPPPVPQILLPAATWTVEDQSLLAGMNITLGDDVDGYG